MYGIENFIMIVNVAVSLLGFLVFREKVRFFFAFRCLTKFFVQWPLRRFCHSSVSTLFAPPSDAEKCNIFCAEWLAGWAIRVQCEWDGMNTEKKTCKFTLLEHDSSGICTHVTWRAYMMTMQPMLALNIVGVRVCVAQLGISSTCMSVWNDLSSGSKGGSDTERRWRYALEQSPYTRDEQYVAIVLSKSTSAPLNGLIGLLKSSTISETPTITIKRTFPCALHCVCVWERVVRSPLSPYRLTFLLILFVVVFSMQLPFALSKWQFRLKFMCSDSVSYDGKGGMLHNFWFLHAVKFVFTCSIWTHSYRLRRRPMATWRRWDGEKSRESEFARAEQFLWKGGRKCWMASSNIRRSFALEIMTFTFSTTMHNVRRRAHTHTHTPPPPSPLCSWTN